MRIGFTGTRDLHTSEQARIDAVVAKVSPGSCVVTGACLGVDAYVARAAKNAGLTVWTIVPGDWKLVDPAWYHWCDFFEEMPAKSTYKARNLRIVEMSDALVGFPRWRETDPKSRGSGTWQTVRMARKRGMQVTVELLGARFSPVQL